MTQAWKWWMVSWSKQLPVWAQKPYSGCVPSRNCIKKNRGFADYLLRNPFIFFIINGIQAVAWQTYPTALKRQLLSEGITLLTTVPSISPGLKNSRNKKKTQIWEGQKGIRLAKLALTLVIFQTTTPKQAKQEQEVLYVCMLAARPPPRSTLEHKEANRYSAN
jgi:hypothetical protein